MMLAGLRTELDRRLFLVCLSGLIVLAWLSLWIWGESPYQRYLNHHLLAETGGDGRLFPMFVGGWVLMTVAMMLPTSLPLITTFRRVVDGRADRGRLLALLLAGYLSVWTIFGALVFLGDGVLHQVVHRLGWLEANVWLIVAATLLLAGIYQFTSLKYRCLDRCRSPLSFVTEHWRGKNESAQALWLGVHHGLFCIGCCWSLMLVMFAVGIGNLGWMIALSAVMATEKNLSWGRKLSAPLGIALVIWGLAVVATSTPYWPAGAILGL